MEDLAAFTALNHLGSFGKNFVKFKKNKNVIYRLRVGPYGENCDRGLTVGLGQHFQDLDHSFSPYGTPSRQITYISLVISYLILLRCDYSNQGHPGKFFAN